MPATAAATAAPMRTQAHPGKPLDSDALLSFEAAAAAATAAPA